MLADWDRCFPHCEPIGHHLRVAFPERWVRFHSLPESKQQGLGGAFAERVQEVFGRISVHPKLHAEVYADIRKAVVTKFPYCVFYRAEAARVEVIAVFHSSRNPSIWQGRA